MIETLQGFVSGMPEWLQWIGVALISMIPFVESYLGTAIGVLAGLPPVAAVTAAITGNLIVVLILIAGAAKVRGRVRRDATPPAPSPRREKVQKMFDRFGVPGVSLLVHPTQISSVVMVGLGAKVRTVVLWQVVSIVLWAALIGTVVSFGLYSFTR